MQSTSAIFTIGGKRHRERARGKERGAGGESERMRTRCNIVCAQRRGDTLESSISVIGGQLFGGRVYIYIYTSRLLESTGKLAKIIGRIVESQHSPRTITANRPIPLESANVRANKIIKRWTPGSICRRVHRRIIDR